MSDQPPAQTPPAALDTAAEQIAAAQAEPPASAPARRSGWFIFVTTFCMFASMLCLLMPGIFSLAVKVQLIDPGAKETSLGLVVSVGALCGLLSAPLLGHLSDRTTLRWGRRRPFLLGGIAAALVGFTIIALSPTVPLLAVGWVIAQVGLTAVSTAFSIVIPEYIPDAQRGKASALVGVATQLGGVAATLLGALLVENMLALFLAPLIALAVAAVLYWTTIPDRPARAADLPPASVAAVFSAYVFNPRKHRDFSLVWAGKFLLQVGLAFFSTYQVYFLLDRLGFTPAETGTRMAMIGGIGILVTTAGAIVSGILSDRLKRRKVFIYVASAMFATGLVMSAFADQFLVYALGGLLVVGAAGVFGAVDLALASDVLPHRETQAAKYMNIYSISATLPNALAPAIAPVVLAIGTGSNYTALFLTAAILAVAGGLFVIPIRGAR